jgi:methyl-accepting chemotaxis protein
MSNSLDQILLPYISDILNNLMEDLEEVISLKGELTKEERDTFLNILNETEENLNSFGDELTPQINSKITNIKRLLSENDELHEGEEHPLNTTPLSDIQEN